MEAQIWKCGDVVDYTPDAALSAGEVIQLPDGRAAVTPVAVAAAAQDGLQVEGIFKMTKASGFVALPGGRAYWDHSANALTFRKVNDRDFYVGRFVFDAASTDTTCYVALNVDPPYDIDVMWDGVLSVPTGTQAVGAFGYPKRLGGAALIELTSTSEAQCIDILSVDRFAPGANAIVDAIIRVPVNGSGAAVDFNIGVANGTHTSDADSISEYCFAHIDGGSTAINAQSKDGTTTVAATDTTKTISAGSAVANRKEIWFDMRDISDVQIYVDGVLVLADTVFNLGAATGPFGLLAHLEKTTGTTTGQFVIDALRARFAQK